MVKERPVYKPRPRYIADGDYANGRHETALLPDERPAMRGIVGNRVSVAASKDWPLGVRALAFLAGALLMVSVAAFGFLYLVIKAAEPPIPNTDLYALNRPAAYTILDGKNNVAGIRGARVGERLKLGDMPAYLPLAFLAMEDRRFYGHNGIDPIGLLRAAVVDYKAGAFVQGGSTITQQLVKILLLTPDRTIWRKIREVSGAWAIEEKLSKNEILELYLNRIYLGSGAYGVDGAAHVYFGKSARKVTLAEAAMLAALTTAPSTFSPRRDLAKAQARADLALNALVSTGALTERDVAAARANPATIADTSGDIIRNYFLDAALAEAKELTNMEGDLVIATTLDPKMQETAHLAVAEVMDRQARPMRASQAALVAMSTDGAVRALIGGRDYAQSSFNRVTQARRQPGSAFKPFVYLTALERGLTPSTVRMDEPIAIKNWTPDNYGYSHSGPVTLRDALTRSINTVAVRLGQEVGLKSVVATAHRVGIQSNMQPNASLSLGTYEVTPLELTSAYATFASGGYEATAYTVREVRSGDGTVLYARPAKAARRVIREEPALTMNGMLYRVVQSGTGRAASVPGHEVAGKTGTSADWRDAWFVGFSSNLVTGVWIGNDDFSPMKKVTGGSLPAQVWSGFMRAALQKTPAAPLEMLQPEPEYFADSDEGFVERGLNRLGTFFDRLFDLGGDSSERISNADQWRRTDERRSGEDRRAYADAALPYDAPRGYDDRARDPYDDRRATAELNRRQYAAGRDEPYAAGGGSSAYRTERPSYREDPRSNNDGRYYGDRYRPDYAQGRYGYDRR